MSDKGSGVSKFLAGAIAILTILFGLQRIVDAKYDHLERKVDSHTQQDGHPKVLTDIATIRFELQYSNKKLDDLETRIRRLEGHRD